LKLILNYIFVHFFHEIKFYYIHLKTVKELNFNLINSKIKLFFSINSKINNKKFNEYRFEI